MYLSTYVYMDLLCIYVYVYTCIRVCVYMCAYMYMCACVHVYMCICVCYVCIYVYAYMCICVCVHICICVYMYMCIRVYVYTCMCVHICMYVHVHVYTQVLKRMAAHGVTKTVASYNTLITGMLASGKLAAAVSLSREMEKEGLQAQILKRALYSAFI